MINVILGCGYTGTVLAHKLLDRGERVIATSRGPNQLAALAERGAEVIRFDASQDLALRFVPEGSRVVISIPSDRGDAGMSDATPAIVRQLGDRPVRVIYLSTTAVYGPAKIVDENTQPEPRTERERLRVVAEQAVLAGPWNALVLRPAAIYGQGRGVHVSLARGDYPLVGDGSNFVSRIHVEDLAAHIEAGLGSDVTGAYPVADEEPCTSKEIVMFCTSLLGLPMPSSIPAAGLHESRLADRKVDGRAIRRLLGIHLRYPSYRVGIPAALAEQYS